MRVDLRVVQTMSVDGGFVPPGGIDRNVFCSIRNISCGLSKLLGAVVNRFISAVVGFGHSGKGRRPSSHEKVLHPPHFVWPELFAPTHLAETEALQPWEGSSALFLTMPATRGSRS